MNKVRMKWDGQRMSAEPEIGSYLRIHAAIGDSFVFQGKDKYHVHFENSPFNAAGDPQDIESGVSVEVMSGEGELHEFWVVKVLEPVPAGTNPGGSDQTWTDPPQGQIDIDGH